MADFADIVYIIKNKKCNHPSQKVDTTHNNNYLRIHVPQRISNYLSNTEGNVANIETPSLTTHCAAWQSDGCCGVDVGCDGHGLGDLASSWKERTQGERQAEVSRFVTPPGHRLPGCVPSYTVTPFLCLLLPHHTSVQQTRVNCKRFSIIRCKSLKLLCGTNLNF